PGQGRPRQNAGTHDPAGLGISSDGRWLYIAENLGDALAVLDTKSSAVVQRVATERYPYAVAVSLNGTVYVSAWGGRTVSVLRSSPATGVLHETARVQVGRHPSALLLSGDARRLFVASSS